MELSKAKKISIIGISGSGKSTLAVKLGKILALPVHHIDYYFWQPNWVQRDKQELIKQIDDIIKQDSWIIEGTYKQTLTNRFLHSDAVIWLNLSIDLAIQSITERRSQEERIGLPEYLTETDMEFNNLINHVKGYENTINKHITPLVKKYKKKVIELKTHAQIDEFVVNLQKEKKQ